MAKAGAGDGLGVVVLDNPILNSPFREPLRHWVFSAEGAITDEIATSRRTSAYYVPVPPAKRQKAQLVLEADGAEGEHRENEFINAVRRKVGQWRALDRPHVTPTTRLLLDHWTDPERDNRLFFCQIEALETAIYLLEAAPRDTGTRFDDLLADHAEAHNPGLERIAFKMATGSGKTVVMAMLIAWHTLNTNASRTRKGGDPRFTNEFLVVTPGITIRDRLRVLLPADPNNYYDERDLIPPELRRSLNQANVAIVNYHKLMRTETVAASKVAKEILAADFSETPEEMVARVCRDLPGKRQLVVLNDEAHHCYLPKPPSDEHEEFDYTGDARKEAEASAAQARVWARGLQHIAGRRGLKAVYDLSATPFFLDGSGYRPGDLFPWVVSDFSLIDAIESGVVKIPRVPVADDAIAGTEPTYRELWPHIGKALPKRVSSAAQGTEPVLPKQLEGALRSLYGHYAESFAQWETSPWGEKAGEPPPVLIVVCQNTAISKLVFDHISGWERPSPDTDVTADDSTASGTDVKGGTTKGGDPEAVLVHGALELFDNVADHGPDARDRRWVPRPRTILIDSRQLESGDGLSAEFKKIAAAEIAEFKTELRARGAGADAEDLDDTALLREVMNTVGKPNRLGEHVRCVVSVSMLTEGWDANTVTHILGVRAFGTSLLQEQVIGRGLRRRSYVADDDGMFEPEYAEVYGVPFNFIPTSGVTPEPPPLRRKTRVRALPERSHLAIEFPVVRAYRYEVPEQRILADWEGAEPLVISTAELPSEVEIEGHIGDTSIHTLGELLAQRPQTVEFKVASAVLERLTAGEGHKPVLFPQVLRITREWLAHPATLELRDSVAVQWLLFGELKARAAEKIVTGIVRAGGERDPIVRAVLSDTAPLGSSEWVDFETVRDTVPTDPAKSHVSDVVLDSGWEESVAKAIEKLDGVRCYVRNDHMGFTIPYTYEGVERRFVPDFLVSAEVGDGERPATVVVEVSGEDKPEKQAKVEATRELWLPAVNTHRGFGRWSFVEIDDPTNVKIPLSAALEAATTMP